MSDSAPVDKGGLYGIEALLRANASAGQVLELDGLLVDMEVPEHARTVQAQMFIEKFVEGVKHAGET